MFQEQLDSFLHLVREDLSLQQRLASCEDPATLASIAAEYGFQISEEQFSSLAEISEEELESVSGGIGLLLPAVQTGARCR
jgi:predicted ribosomally synthesized peptide with nif11-like leader